MIGVNSNSPEQINRANTEIIDTVIDRYNKDVTAINRETLRILMLIDELMSYRTAQLQKPYPVPKP